MNGVKNLSANKSPEQIDPSLSFGMEVDGKEKDGYELIEIKTDRMPIGIHAEMKEFTNNELQLQKGDALYLFSDGYADQFGGEKGKKFKYSRFRELLLSIHDKPMEEQKTILDKTFEDWKGNLEQLYRGDGL